MQMLIFRWSLVGETSVEEEGYNDFYGLEVNQSPNPNFNDDFSQFGLKTGRYRISYKMY